MTVLPVMTSRSIPWRWGSISVRIRSGGIDAKWSMRESTSAPQARWGLPQASSCTTVPVSSSRASTTVVVPMSRAAKRGVLPVPSVIPVPAMCACAISSPSAVSGLTACWQPRRHPLAHSVSPSTRQSASSTGRSGVCTRHFPHSPCPPQSRLIPESERAAPHPLCRGQPRWISRTPV